MTVEELIKLLEACPPDAEIKAEDYEGHYIPVTDDDEKVVRLYYEH